MADDLGLCTFPITKKHRISQETDTFILIYIQNFSETMIKIDTHKVQGTEKVIKKKLKKNYKKNHKKRREKH